jgi:hypothetical protein
MEISLVKTFGWSLHDIDETDIESLLPFIHQYTAGGTPRAAAGSQPGRVYADQASWL